MAAAAPFASASLYVGDLAKDVSEAHLFELFSSVGPVASVRICRDAHTRRSLGYAYVNFHRAEDADRALTTMNFKQIRGVPCRIMWSHRDPSLRKSGVGNVFVKNLAKSIGHKELYDTFSMFGSILSCKVALNDQGESLGYGFVHYENEEDAQKAIQHANGKIIIDKKVTVETFKPKRERVDKSKFTNLYIKFLPLDYTQDKLARLFSKFGEVNSTKLAVDKDGKFRGVGFVNFTSPDHAKAALNKLNNTDLGGEQKLFVAAHQSRRERERELRSRWEAQKLERQKQYRGVNLYVKNLPDNVDDKRLADEFKKFGELTSTKVMTEDGKSKGFGFICFKNQEDANRALSDMNGQLLEGKPLYVAVAQRKDERRAQLEAQYAHRAYQGPTMYGGYQGQIFYQRPMMYPQMVPRWSAPGGPQMGVPGQAVNYQLMPAPGRGGPRGGRGGRGRGGPGRGQGLAGPGGAGASGPTPGSSAPHAASAPGQQYDRVRYHQNVRNAQQTGSAAPQPIRGPQGRGAPNAAAAAAAGGGRSAGWQDPLPLSALTSVPSAQAKQLLGERLFPLVFSSQPERASKITGMLLEMDNGELVALLEDPKSLQEKIAEAIYVLDQHDDEEADEEEEEEA